MSNIVMLAPSRTSRGPLPTPKRAPRPALRNLHKLLVVNGGLTSFRRRLFQTCPGYTARMWVLGAIACIGTVAIFIYAFVS